MEETHGRETCFRLWLLVSFRLQVHSDIDLFLLQDALHPSLLP